MTDHHTPAALLRRMPVRLVLKHIGDDASNPLAMHTEDGKLLPEQGRVTIINNPGEFVRVQVEFVIAPGGNVTIAATPEPPALGLPNLEVQLHG